MNEQALLVTRRRGHRQRAFGTYPSTAQSAIGACPSCERRPAMSALGPSYEDNVDVYSRHLVSMVARKSSAWMPIGCRRVAVVHR